MKPLPRQQRGQDRASARTRSRRNRQADSGSQANHSVCFLLGASVIQVHNKPACDHRRGGEPGNRQVPPLSQADLNDCGPPQKPLKKYIQYKQNEWRFKRTKEPSEQTFLFHAGEILGGGLNKSLDSACFS